MNEQIQLCHPASPQATEPSLVLDQKTISLRGFASSSSTSRAVTRTYNNSVKSTASSANTRPDILPWCRQQMLRNDFVQHFCQIPSLSRCWSDGPRTQSCLTSEITGRRSESPPDTLHSSLSLRVKASHKVNNLCKNPTNLQNFQECLTMHWVKCLPEIDFCC